MSLLRTRIRTELSGPAVPLMAFGVAINLTVGQITAALKLPIYLDSIGTILTAVLCGPWAAILTGSMANLLAAAVGNPTMAFFIPVVVFIGASTAFLARRGWFCSLPMALLGGVIVGILAAVISAPIAAYVFGGTMMAGTDLLVILYRSFGYDILRSTLLQGLTSDPIDKAISFTLVFLTLRNLPSRILGRFPGSSYLRSAN